MGLTAAALLIFTLMSPGPLDRFGGHADIMNDQYHMHAGASYQFRYVDLSGRTWTGNGPRPEESLIMAGTDDVDHEGFFFLIAGSLIVAATVLGLHIAKRLAYLHYRRRVHAHHEEWPVVSRQPSIERGIPLNMPVVRIVSPQPGLDRRRHERRDWKRRVALAFAVGRS